MPNGWSPLEFLLAAQFRLSQGSLAQIFSVPLVIFILSMLGLGGAVMSRRLPEVT